MRHPLLLILVLILSFTACKKSEDLPADRWVEKSQGQEVIVFRDAQPNSALDNQEQSFYFQARVLPVTSGMRSPSGIYFYQIQGDSLILRTSGQKVYFKMNADGQSFTIGRFFDNYGNLPEKLIFERQ